MWGTGGRGGWHCWPWLGRDGVAGEVSCGPGPGAERDRRRQVDPSSKDRGAGPWRWEGWHPTSSLLVLISRAAKDGPGQQAVGLLSS